MSDPKQIIAQQLDGKDVTKIGDTNESVDESMYDTLEKEETEFWKQVREKGLNPLTDDLERMIKNPEADLNFCKIEIDKMKQQIIEKDQLISTLYAREKQYKEEITFLKSKLPNTKKSQKKGD
jgi:asparagine synthetase A